MDRLRKQDFFEGKIDFYYSMGSRYSYLASTQIAKLERDTGCSVEWIPVNSDNPFNGENGNEQYDWKYRELDARRWADLYGVPFVEPRGRVQFDSALIVHSCTAARVCEMLFL